MLKTNLTSSLVLPFLKDIYQTVILVFAELNFNLKNYGTLQIGHFYQRD